MNKISILLVDDHAILRKGLRALIEPHADLEIVGEAADGAEAIARVNELLPDVVVMDIAMPGINGLMAARQILQAHQQMRILMLTQYDNREYVLPLLKMGVAGYVLKQTVDSDLVAAIRAVAGGKSYLDPTVTRLVLDAYLHDEPVEDTYSLLSDREREVLILVAQGHTAREIAELLHISASTVDVHRAHIMQKLNLHSVAELSAFAVRRRLIRE
ncbi:MAG: response regulator transcription factor [Chloroflexi bacterium]|nr:response regulator transcription factor [Chloroflexota bacterium]